MTFLRNVWYAAAHSHELDGGLVSRKICNQQVVLFKTSDGKISALEDRCPHRFVPLSMGKREGDTLRCGYHGLAFDATGACSSAPNDGDEQRALIRVRAFTAFERYAIIWLWLGSPELADPDMVPTFDFITDPRYAVARGHSYFKASYEMLADNLLDLSHVHYLHPGVHDGADFSGFTNKVKVEGDTVWSMLWRHSYPLDERRKMMFGIDRDNVEGQGHSRWDAPGNLLVDTAYWEHGKSVDDDATLRTPSAHLLTPESEGSTHYFWLAGRTNDIANEERTLATERNMRMIFETQDGPMCEAQQAALGPNTDFLTAKPVILKADAAGLAARRVIKRKLRAEGQLADSSAHARLKAAFDPV